MVKDELKIGNPAEVVLVRMTSDGRLPIERRRNYKYRRIIKIEMHFRHYLE